MAVKKQQQQPLFTSVARMIGHAAGTLANLTHEIADRSPATSDSKKGEASDAAMPDAPSLGRIKRAKKRRTTPAKRTKSAAPVNKARTSKRRRTKSP